MKFGVGNYCDKDSGNFKGQKAQLWVFYFGGPWSIHYALNDGYKHDVIMSSDMTSLQIL